MIDFLMISTRSTKRGVMEIYPKFIIKKSSDLMVRGGDFYAIWIEELGLWSTDEQDALQLIDRELDKYAEENKQKFDSGIKILHMWDAETGMIDSWHKYCQKQLRDSFVMLDEHLIFSNTITTKTDYASKRLKYPLVKGEITAYEKLMSTLYEPEERHKIEWSIGSIVSGESKKLQKFLVLYGSAGTGKSTVLNMIQQLFDGYYSVFDAKALGSSSNSFALESFKSNPLVSIQHDGDLSRIEDNTRLNSLVSHEMMTVNEKFKSQYANSFKCFLFMGTNKPVKITDAKSGLIRRLIDVTPSGNKVESKEYDKLVKQINFEIGAIAYHCQEVYTNNPAYYNDYVPVSMLGASNDFYNFVMDSYFVFKQQNGTTLKAAWEMYKNYCDDAKVPYPYPQRAFKEELKNYFQDYKERFVFEDGTRARSYYDGFLHDKFESSVDDTNEKVEETVVDDLGLSNIPSLFDYTYSDCPAQYATKDKNEAPLQKWANVTTKLSSIDTSKIHYVKVPENHIIIDFDITDEEGNKSYEKNIKAASLWPPTYTEVSKGGSGIHLHYNFTGDPNTLSRIYADHVEIKVFAGNSSLRRRLTKCNNLPVADISSGLPLKGAKVVNFDAVKNEKGIRALVKKNINKGIHPGTKPSIDFIYKILEDAYNSGIVYNISDLRSSILAFAAGSSNQSDYCIKLVGKMQFKSKESESISETLTKMGVQNVLERPIVFYDVEVFPNLFLVNWKFRGSDKTVVRMINPTPQEIEDLLQFRLVGYNCRRYDNHIMYGRLMGYTNEQLYNLSQKIINNVSGCFFGEAYNLSYTDVYDFASAGNKMGLKKWEIKLGIKHHELGLPWDKPVPEEKWIMVAEYCDDDVIATEIVFDHLSGDWTARQILADIAGMTVNDTTNTLTTRIIFGGNRKPQSQFNYRDLSQPVEYLDEEVIEFLKETKPKMMNATHCGWDLENEDSIPFGRLSLLPYFPGYKFELGKSTYRGTEVGEGGEVYAEPGMYGLAALLDVISMHPNSAIAEVIFGLEFTLRFKEIVDGRVSIKHEAWEIVNKMLGGILTPYIQKVINEEMTSGQLANALKTAINSVYGLTSAHFDNPFRDPRNKDNIIAKRGALFMIDLRHAVQERGFTVAHIKTDSIKIPDATPQIIKFVMDMGAKYGYEFEHEATYDRMCLVNDAVYIAKYATPEKCMELYGYVPGDCKKKGGQWTATGTQFAVPYVFKMLFSGEDVVFEDMCETKSVTSSLYLDMNERLGDDHDYHFIGKVGSFSPIKEGCGGGLLMREKDGKYYAATGTKGYRWMESHVVSELDKVNDIDRGYYDALANTAVESISKYGDFEWFVSDDPYVSPPFETGKYMDKPCYNVSLPWN
jgi:phage/plasmid-associated DNA primase